MELVGQIVRATDWPGTKGERYLVVEPYESKAYGACVWARRLDKGYPGPWVCMPVDCLRLDRKAGKTFKRALEINNTGRTKKRKKKK